MKALCIATTLALLGSSAAYAGTILDTAIGSGDARLKVEDCGNDTCGTITFGTQKFVVKKSDISSFFKDLDLGDKPSSAKERGKPAAAGNRAGATQAIRPARPDDRDASSGRRDEPAASRSDDRPASRWDDRPSPTTAKSAAAPVEQNIAVSPVASDPTSPIGEWITEGGEGRVRISACGQALCGVVAGGSPDDTDRHNPDPAKRNRPLDGMTVLIDMKPAKTNRWEGQIYNVKDGRTYASNISLKSADCFVSKAAHSADGSAAARTGPAPRMLGRARQVSAGRSADAARPRRRLSPTCRQVARTRWMAMGQRGLLGSAVGPGLSY